LQDVALQRQVYVLHSRKAHHVRRTMHYSSAIPTSRTVLLLSSTASWKWVDCARMKFSLN
jgi:hypothetical protein